jgi:hypothetical protein
MRQGRHGQPISPRHRLRSNQRIDDRFLDRLDRCGEERVLGVVGEHLVGKERCIGGDDDDTGALAVRQGGLRTAGRDVGDLLSLPGLPRQ